MEGKHGHERSSSTLPFGLFMPNYLQQIWNDHVFSTVWSSAEPGGWHSIKKPCSWQVKGAGARADRSETLFQSTVTRTTSSSQKIAPAVQTRCSVSTLMPSQYYLCSSCTQGCILISAVVPGSLLCPFRVPLAFSNTVCGEPCWDYIMVFFSCPLQFKPLTRFSWLNTAWALLSFFRGAALARLV